MKLSHIERFLPPAFTLMVFALMFSALFWVGMPLLEDPDTPWHLMTGLKILELGALPASDPWSFTAQGHRWYILSWGWDALIAYAYQLGGMRLLYMFIMVVSALSAAILARHLLSRRELTADAILFTLLLVFLTLADFATARPHIISAVWIVSFHYILHRSRSSEDRCILALLPAIMVLWVNTHAGFFVGFSLLGVYGLEALVRRDLAWLRVLVVAGIACVIVLPINPYGFNAYYGVVDTLGSKMNGYINEWQPYAFDSHYGSTAWGFLLIAASYYGRARVPLADTLITFLWFAAMFVAQRNAFIFVLVSAPYMALSLQQLSVKLARYRHPQADVRELLERPGMSAGWAVGAIIIVFLSYINIERLGDSIGYGRPIRSDAAKALTVFETYCSGKRFLNEYEYGGRIIYQTQGKCPVFYDGRTSTSYPESVAEAYIQFITLAPGWQEMLKRYNIKGLFVMNEDAFAAAYEDGEYHDQWRRVYRDDVASIFLKK